MKTRCQYFERYGDSGRKGLCEETARLALADQGPSPLPIVVCAEHADRIVARFPELGIVSKRFISINQLDEFGRLPAVSPSK